MSLRFSWLLVVVFAAACDRPERAVRHYKEIRFAKKDSPAIQVDPAAVSPAVAPTPASRMGDLPAEALGDKLPLVWTTPDGWENAGASGIRIGTLRVQGVECSIISFPGDVGGDEANLRRWLGQIAQQVTDEQLATLVAGRKTLVSEGGFDVRLYDGEPLLGPDAAQNVLAGIIPVADQTVFVKMSGDRSLLAAQKNAFVQLCGSIRLREEGSGE